MKVSSGSMRSHFLIDNDHAFGIGGGLMRIGVSSHVEWSGIDPIFIITNVFENVKGSLNRDKCPIPFPARQGSAGWS